MVEVRARLQRALGRPFPLEEVSTLTLAKLRELEAESGLTTRPGAAAGKVHSLALAPFMFVIYACYRSQRPVLQMTELNLPTRPPAGCVCSGQALCWQ